MEAHLENDTVVDTVPIYITIPKRGELIECAYYHSISLISHTNKIMLRVIQCRLEPDIRKEMFMMVFENAEEHETRWQR